MIDNNVTSGPLGQRRHQVLRAESDGSARVVLESSCVDDNDSSRHTVAPERNGHDMPHARVVRVGVLDPERLQDATDELVFGDRLPPHARQLLHDLLVPYALRPVQRGSHM